jgi:lipid-A-disaccharide synthase
MRAAGVETIVNSDELAVMGIAEVARAFPKFSHAFKQLKQAALDKKPAAVIMVDWPEFNLRLAKALHPRGLKTIHYISPQLWAWRSYRVNQIRRDVDLVLAILPFEVEWFAQRGMDRVEYVGHPLAGKVHARFDRAEFCRLHDLDQARPIVSLLPGSRHKELVRILPPMIEGAALVAAERSDVQFVVVVAPSRSVSEVNQIISNVPVPPEFKSALRVVEQQTREALFASDAAAIASGTATLEAALLNTPMVIVYKESALNWHTLGSLTHPDHYGLPNIVAGQRLFTELLQDDLNPQRLARELHALLDPDRNRRLRSELQKIQQDLGDADASRNAAQAILKAITS